MFLSLLIKGFIVGISFTIPGCSGGTFSVYVGIYDELLHALGNLFKEFKKSMTFLIPVGLGLAIGILLFSKLMALALQANSFITIMVFIGLTIGGVPNLFQKIKGNKVTASGIVSFIVAFAIVIVMVIFQVLSGANNIDHLEMNALNILLLFALGFICAITMIIPGVSGSALLLILGFYTAIVSNVVGNLLNFGNFGYNLFILIPFALGAVAGVLSVSKILETTLRKFPVQSYLGIIGFILSSAAILLLWIRDPETADAFVEQEPIYLNLGGYLAAHGWSVVIGIVGLGVGLFGSTQIVKLGLKGKNGVR